ncbi:MAG TPA: hypothetical protein VEC36_08210 [Patescibacteria group bacterium]|nr:hypothetical protein [Patescibacteria group bacterium]
MKNTWIYDYWEDSESDEKSISGFYFTSEFETQPIPIQYARMIQYSDCMVDTTTEIFKADAKRDRNYKESGKIAEFLKYVHEESDKPHFWEDRNKPKDFRTWDSVRFALVESKLSKQEKFQKMLKAAVAEALVEGSNEAFDEYVARFYSKQTALELRRNRIVVGSCSQDNSPRVHAMKIAVLSAETVNWETFLRAHLDIMNDRFQRRSDGSYAWAGRQTYIQELEALDINVMDLMLGISLRLENPSQKHYFGSIGRLGRALSETKYAAEIETKILSMLKDDELDDYNRLLMYYLFDNYNYHIKDESRKKENAARLSAAVQEMPEYLAVKLAAKK